MSRCKEIHIYLDRCDIPDNCMVTYCETENAIKRGVEIIHTTLLDFMSFHNAGKIFVHYKSNTHEITLGECEGTQRFIRESHNLQRMLIAGEFDWFTD